MSECPKKMPQCPRCGISVSTNGALCAACIPLQQRDDAVARAEEAEEKLSRVAAMLGRDLERAESRAEAAEAQVEALVRAGDGLRDKADELQKELGITVEALEAAKMYFESKSAADRDVADDMVDDALAVGLEAQESLPEEIAAWDAAVKGEAT